MERRLRGEIEREKGLARGAEGSVSALSSQLEEAAKEASEKAALVAELKSRLEEVQVGTAVVLGTVKHCLLCVSAVFCLGHWWYLPCFLLCGM